MQPAQSTAGSTTCRASATNHGNVGPTKSLQLTAAPGRTDSPCRHVAQQSGEPRAGRCLKSLLMKRRRPGRLAHCWVSDIRGALGVAMTGRCRAVLEYRPSETCSKTTPWGEKGSPRARLLMPGRRQGRAVSQQENAAMKCRAARMGRSLLVPTGTVQREAGAAHSASPGARSPAHQLGEWSDHQPRVGEQVGEGLEDKAERTTSGNPLLHTAASCPFRHRPGYPVPHENLHWSPLPSTKTQHSLQNHPAVLPPQGSATLTPTPAPTSGKAASY